MDIKASAAFFNGNIKDADRVPFSYPRDGKTQRYGEVVPFRESGSSGKLLAVGLWRCITVGKSPARRFSCSKA